MPVAGLISKKYAASLREGIADKATPAADIRAGKPADFEGRNTTHFSVIDRDGNAVSNTYTLNFSYGLGLVADGTGVLLNNELDDFTAKPGAANAYGLVGSNSNLPGPGKRPLSSMTPTIVLKDGKPFLVTGSPGGSRIITAVLQVITNVIDFHMSIAEAVTAPRLHNQWQPDEADGRAGLCRPAVLDALAPPATRSCRCRRAPRPIRSRSPRTAMSAPPTRARAARWRRGIEVKWCGLPSRSSRRLSAFALVGFGATAFTRSASEGWSGRRDSNPRPRPWQGRALPLSYTRIRRKYGRWHDGPGRQARSYSQ